jgi:3-oxoacyl-[acyl-carrier protein] reductase
MTLADLDGRVALVTGGSGGIGRAIAIGLADAGCDVAVTYAANTARAEETADLVSACGRRAFVVRADLTDPATGVVAINEAAETLGPISVLVANAAVGRIVEGIDEVDNDLWKHTFDVNVHAPFLQCQRVLPAMAASGFGRILFTSSAAATTGGLIGPHYAASKSALIGLVAWLASRYAPSGVTVNAIAPALIDDTTMRPDAPPPLVGRLGTPSEIADIAMTMITNGYVTGKTWTIDGGLHAGR